MCRVRYITFRSVTYNGINNTSNWTFDIPGKHISKSLYYMIHIWHGDIIYPINLFITGVIRSYNGINNKSDWTFRISRKHMNNVLYYAVHIFDMVK